MSHYVKHVAYYECDGCGRHAQVEYEGSVRSPLPPVWKQMINKLGDEVDVCSDMCEFRIKTGKFPPDSPHGP